MRRFNDIKAVQYAFNGIRAGVLALLIKALFTMYKKVGKNIFSYIVMAFSFVFTAIVKIKIIYVIILCAVFGLAASYIAERRSTK